MAVLVEVSPGRVLVEGLKSLKGPIAPVGFQQARVFERGQIMRFGEDGGGFAGALNGAGADFMDGRGGKQSREGFGLCPAFFVQRNVRCAAGENAV